MYLKSHLMSLFPYNEKCDGIFDKLIDLVSHISQIHWEHQSVKKYIVCYFFSMINSNRIKLYTGFNKYVKTTI